MNELNTQSQQILFNQNNIYSPTIGDVFFSRESNILDVIRFYEITQIISANKVAVRELHQLNEFNYEQDYGSCCPLIGKYISQEILVCIHDQFLFENERNFASLLTHTDLKITDTVTVKIWNTVTHKISDF